MRLLAIRHAVLAVGLVVGSACAEVEDGQQCLEDPASCFPVFTADSSTALPGTTPDGGSEWTPPGPWDSGLPAYDSGFPLEDSAVPGAVDGGAGDGSVQPSDGSVQPSDGSVQPGDGSAEPGGSGVEQPADGGVVMPSDGMIRGPTPTKSTAENSGSYRVQSYTNGFRDGPKYADATIWYPTNAEPPFAGVAVVPGFISPQSSIRNWGPFLASHGIVTITIGTNGGGDLPKVRAEALMDALETIKSEGKRAASPLAGKIDDSRMGVMGWSMGGGGAMWAATGNPSLKAAISLCGWETGPSFQRNTVPSLLLASTGDGVAPTNSHSAPFYRAIPASTPKLLFELRGGSHNSANDPANHGRVMGLLGLSWMKVFLEGDERYRQFLEQEPSSAARFESTL